MRLGLFGGRFDPVHSGHLLVAQEALERLKLDSLWFVPAQSPPHKSAVASAEARYEMLLLATTSHPAFEVSRLELERSGPSYSFDTVSEVKKRQPGATIFFITGVDAFLDIASWHRAKDLVETVNMVSVARPGYNLEGLEPNFRERVQVLETRQCDISSTEIRQRLAAERPIRYLVPELVETYLVKQHLYLEQPLQPS